MKYYQYARMHKLAGGRLSRQKLKLQYIRFKWGVMKAAEALDRMTPPELTLPVFSIFKDDGLFGKNYVMPPMDFLQVAQ